MHAAATLDIILQRLLAVLITLLGAASALIYYTTSLFVLTAGSSLAFLALYLTPAILRDLVEHMPVTLKRLLDRRLHQSFISKVKAIERAKDETRARLVSLIQDVEIRNKANNSLLKKIRANEAIIRRKVRIFKSRVLDRYQVDATKPGILEPPHLELEVPSPSGFVRWVYAQDFVLYSHYRGVAKYEVQIPSEEMKIQMLEEEKAYLEAILDDTNALRSRVQLRTDLPQPPRMSGALRKYLAQLPATKSRPSPYQYYVAPTSF